VIEMDKKKVLKDYKEYTKWINEGDAEAIDDFLYWLEKKGVQLVYRDVGNFEYFDTKEFLLFPENLENS